MSDARRAKVGDFGLSRVVDKQVVNMNTRWLAAEVIENGSWPPASDVCSFGVVLLEMLTWELPWSHFNNPYMVRHMTSMT